MKQEDLESVSSEPKQNKAHFGRGLSIGQPETAFGRGCMLRIWSHSSTEYLRTIQLRSV